MPTSTYETSVIDQDTPSLLDQSLTHLWYTPFDYWKNVLTLELYWYGVVHPWIDTFFFLLLIHMYPIKPYYNNKTQQKRCICLHYLYVYTMNINEYTMNLWVKLSTYRQIFLAAQESDVVNHWPNKFGNILRPTFLNVISKHIFHLNYNFTVFSEGSN